tara:strand:- start:174 stop:506 length:333 start_codon:yes stop_codon:yes gene_type:complete
LHGISGTPEGGEAGGNPFGAERSFSCSPAGLLPPYRDNLQHKVLNLLQQLPCGTTLTWLRRCVSLSFFKDPLQSALVNHRERLLKLCKLGLFDIVKPKHGSVAEENHTRV